MHIHIVQTGFPLPMYTCMWEIFPHIKWKVEKLVSGIFVMKRDQLSWN